MNPDDFPAPKDGFVITHFLVVADQDRSREFYQRIFDGKVLIDVANALAGDGFPPTLSVCNTESLGEQIQRAFPNARVVKALNTVTANVMVNPGMISGGHNVFVAGNDASAKATVSTLLQSFGWDAGDVVDLGDISCARGAEMYMPLWIRLYIALGTPNFNIRIVREL